MIFKRMVDTESKSATTLETINSELKILAANIHSGFPQALRMIAVFGSLVRQEFNTQRSDINILMVIDELDIGSLEKLNSVIKKTLIRTYISPILLKKDELPSFARAFPIKFLEIKSCYKVLYGDDLMKDIAIEKEYLRLRCEQELRNILSRMRRLLAMGVNYNNLLAGNFPRFFAYYLSTLKSIAYLMGFQSGDPVAYSAKSLGIDIGLINKLMETKKRHPKSWTESDVENSGHSFLDILEKTIQSLNSFDEK